MALFAVVYLYLGRGLEAGTVEGVPGPGAFPRLLGMAMLLTAAYLASRGLVLDRRRVTPAPAPGTGRPTRGRRVLVLYGLFVLYVLAMPVVGFVVATFAFAAVGMRAAFGVPAWRSALYGALVALLVEGLFVVGLGVPLPAGRLW